MCLLKRMSESNKEFEDCIETTIRILHLGDLHATSPHFDEEIWQRLLDYLKTEYDQNGVFDLAVFPGDIVDRINDNSSTFSPTDKFAKALELIESLAEVVNLTSDKIAIVPGWHDILSDDPHFDAYLSATNMFYNTMPPISEDIDNSALVHRRWILRRLWGCIPVIVLGLNSCDPPDESEIKKTLEKEKKQQLVGKISEGQVNSLISTTGQDEIENSFIVLVYHHPPLPVSLAEKPSAADIGARVLQNVRALHPSLCLMGHLHYSTGGEHKNTIFLSSGNMCYSKDPTSNQFNIIEVGIFAHQKELFGIRQKLTQWVGDKWQENRPSHFYTDLVPKNAQNYFEGHK